MVLQSLKMTSDRGKQPQGKISTEFKYYDTVERQQTD